jgi:aspartate aminotransferase
VQVATPKGFLHVAELPIENADDFARWLLESYDLDGETVMVACWDFTLLGRFKPG